MVISLTGVTWEFKHAPDRQYPFVEVTFEVIDLALFTHEILVKDIQLVVPCVVTHNVAIVH